MPKLTPQQSAQLTATIQDSALTRVAFTAPADGYRLSATATYSQPGAPTFDIGITWIDSGHGVLKLRESINGATVTAAVTSPEHRIALNQLQRLLTMAIRFFRYHVSLAESDAANLRRKASRATTPVTIAVPTTDEARTSTVEALNETAAATATPTGASK